MRTPPDLQLLTDLVGLPVAPFCEEHVTAYVRRWAAQRPKIRLREDAYGNLLLWLKRGQRRAGGPLLLSAHMDHPGFEALHMTGPRTLLAAWRGWVAWDYFAGTPVKFLGKDGWIRGKIRSVTKRVIRGEIRVRRVSVDVQRPVPPKALGMWDLPAPAVRNGKLYAPACDDLAGVATVLSALDHLYAGRGSLDMGVLLTRSEEVGWVGSIAACRSGILPPRARIVTIETSSQIPGVNMGDGPILRVGDQTGLFDPAFTAWCYNVGKDLARRDSSFRGQRKLMDGGDTETLVFRQAGYRATGMCLALGNYHNMDRKNHRIASEYIDLGDFAGLVAWLCALASSHRAVEDADPVLLRAIARLDRTWMAKLARSVRRLRQPG